MGKHSKNKPISFLLIILLILLLCLIGYSLFIYFHSDDQNNNKQVANSLDHPVSNTITKPTIPAISSDLFGEHYAKAETILNGMTLEEKVSQLFIVRCPETNGADFVKIEQPGGYILFGRDFKDKTKNTIIHDITSYQTASTIPMIIGTDEEGGTVVRVSSNPKLVSAKYQSPQTLYQSNGFTAITDDTIHKSKLLLSLGINLNFAPVSDVSTNAKDFIYSRCFGKNAEETGKYVETVVTTMNEQRIGSVLKHFPGYGNNADTHTDVVHDYRPFEQFETIDFVPFQKGIQANVPIILVSHNIVNCMDLSNPASLSPNVHKILREDLGFTGLIVTDDLAMDAIKKYASVSDSVVMAISAGNDLILTSDFNTQKNAILHAISTNVLSEETINASVKKIIAYKYYMGLFK